MTLKILHGYFEFRHRVGLLFDLKDSHGIDLEPCWGVLGLFEKHRLPELKTYIENHPEYHIISSLNNLMFLNQPIENCFGYFLGEGDKDPDLMYVPEVDPIGNFDFEARFNDDSNWLDPLKLRKNKRFTEF